MQIRSIQLRNAKSFDDVGIEFSPGVNAIVGQNGAGKSTIVEAIGLALFGELGYTREDFIREGTSSAVVTVTLESSLDERPYEVVRRVGGGGQYYVRDPEIDSRLCEGRADVEAFVRQHLGLDSTADLGALFRDAVGVAQGTFTASFLQTPANRKSVFDPMLQVADYKTAFDKLLGASNYLREQRHSLEVTISALRTRLEELPGLEQAVARRNDEIAQAVRETSAVQHSLAEAVAGRTTLEAIRSELIELRSDSNRLAERQQSVARELLSAQQTLADATSAQELVVKHQSAYTIYLAAQERQQELDARLRERTQLESERARCTQAIAVADTKLQQLRQEQATIAEALATMERLAGAVRRQEELEKDLSSARQDAVRLENIEGQIAQQHTRCENLAADVDRLGADLARSTKLETQAEAYRAEDESFRLTDEALRNENARLESEAKVITEQTARLEDIRTAVCPVCEQALSDAHRQEMIERNHALLDEMRAKYADAQAHMKSLQRASEERRGLMRQIEQDLRRLPRREDLEARRRESTEANQALEALLAQRSAFEGVGARIAAIEAEAHALGNPKREYEVAQSQADRRALTESGLVKTTAQLVELQKRDDTLLAGLKRFESLDAEMDACAAELRSHDESYRIVLGNRRLAAGVDDRRAAVERLMAEQVTLNVEAMAVAAKVADTAARFDEDAYARFRSQEESQRERLGALETRVRMLQEQQEIDSRSITSLLDTQSLLAESLSQVTTLTEQRETLEFIRATLRDAGPYVTRVLIRQVSDNARQIFSDIMQDYTRQLSWAEDYGIELLVDGHTRVFKQLSGGEQMTAALAVRLALLRELSSIDVAFFDEPTANLDEERREALAQQILQVKGFKQLFVISHDDTFEQATQNLVHVEKVNGVSRVSSG